MVTKFSHVATKVRRLGDHHAHHAGHCLPSSFNVFCCVSQLNTYYKQDEKIS